MKIVLFCGGLGMRLRDYSDQIPKPMVNVGNRPIIWHLMKYYAHFGHKDFVLCLGHKAEYIKNYFLKYDECLSNDFVLSEGGAKLEMVNTDIQNWKITFTDTGLQTNIGGRLRRVQRLVENEEVFLANYTDNLSDLDLDDMIERFLETDLWTNGGFFVFRQAVFDYIHDGEELVEAPFQRLIEQGRLFTYKHEGFWACMDTFKEKQQLEDLILAGSPPWQLWDNQNPAACSLHSSTRESRFKIAAHA